MNEDETMLFAGFGAAAITRRCAELAFRRHNRAMIARDLIPEVGKAYQDLLVESK